MEKILILDHDRACQKALELLLEPEGYTVEASSDGKTGLAVFRTSRPTLVILDLNLPRVPGRDVCREIKRELPSQLVLVLTAAADEAEKVCASTPCFKVRAIIPPSPHRGSREMGHSEIGPQPSQRFASSHKAFFMAWSVPILRWTSAIFASARFRISARLAPGLIRSASSSPISFKENPSSWARFMKRSRRVASWGKIR